MKTKERIIQASIMLFNKHGERAITTNHIASHLSMSPGNLYYHFENKQDIIRHIFSHYKTHIKTNLVPFDREKDAFVQLSHYLDVLSELLRDYHFFYDNMTDILAKDDELKQDYIAFQSRLYEEVNQIILAMKDSGVLNVTTEQAAELTHMIKLMVGFWTPYVKAHHMDNTLEQSDINKGIGKVALLLSVFASPNSVDEFTRLQQRYAS